MLTGGPQPRNLGEIVSSKRFAALIRTLAEEAGVVIVDSPAILTVGDTPALASMVDGLAFLVDPAGPLSTTPERPARSPVHRSILPEGQRTLLAGDAAEPRRQLESVRVWDDTRREAFVNRSGEWVRGTDDWDRSAARYVRLQVSAMADGALERRSVTGGLR